MQIFTGLVTSQALQKNESTYLNDFILTEAILHIPRDDLSTTLKDIDLLSTHEGVNEKILIKLDNFLQSYLDTSVFNQYYANNEMKAKLLHYHFKENFIRIFSNIFIILSRLHITQEVWSKHTKLLWDYIKIEDELYHFNLKELGKFILKKGDLFGVESLMTGLEIAIERDNANVNTYHSLIEYLSQAIKKFHPDYQIENEYLIRKALLNYISNNNLQAYQLRHLIYLPNICNHHCKNLLFKAFEKALDNSFNETFYVHLILLTDYDYKNKDYFLKYTKSTNQSRIATAWAFTDYMHNFYKVSFDFTRAELKEFTNLNEFETWLLNPYKFDYQNFDAKWLIELEDNIVLEKLKGHEKITKALEKELQQNFHPILAKIRYQFFV